MRIPFGIIGFHVVDVKDATADGLQFNSAGSLVTLMSAARNSVIAHQQSRLIRRNFCAGHNSI